MTDEKQENDKQRASTDEEVNWNGVGIGMGMAIGSGIGVAIGTAIGAARNNMGLWLALGMSLGMSTGLALGIAFASIKQQQKAGGECSKCGYSTKGLRMETCSECGADLSEKELDSDRDK